LGVGAAAAAKGHLEALGCLLVVLALSGSRVAALAAALVKFLPAVLLFREPPRRLVAWACIAALSFLPMWGPGLVRGFATYEANWSFNGSVWPVLAWLLGDGLLARRILVGFGALILGWALIRGLSAARLLLVVCGSFVLLSPTVHPWYVLWVLAPALWLRERAFVLLAALAPLSYVVLATRTASGGWEESMFTRIAIWAPVYVLLLLDAWRRFSRAGP
jgi:hypothetical protein